MKAPSRGCGTCKERHISCDRGLPACFHCVRSNRQCQGYGLVLSWPRANDRRRAMRAKEPSVKVTTKKCARTTSQIWIVSTSSRDIEIHHYLTSPDFKLPPIPISMTWSPIKSDTDYDLLQYFAINASNSLIAICPSEGAPNLRDIIIRLALSASERSSKAVLQSLLALSSLHRHGLQANAVRSKLAALSVLAASAKNGVEGHEVVSHVASLMLLCCFEIQHASESSNQWLHYISAVKNVLKAARRSSQDSFDTDPDMVSLLYWVSYHDVLAQFSLSYWKHHRPAKDSKEVDILVQKNMELEASGLPLFCPGMLRIVSEVFQIIGEPGDDKSRMLKNKNLLTLLEWKIRKLPLCVPEQDTAGTWPLGVDDTWTTTLFQLALLIYLERASDYTPEQSAKLRSRIEKGLAIFSRANTLQRQFPLLIIGCEARTDEDRMVVLGLISRTEKNTGIRNLQCMSGIIQSLWVQDDLAEKAIGYTEKMRAVLSSSGILPSFT